MEYSRTAEEILISIESNAQEFKDQLILNPVENIPIKEVLAPSVSFLHGLYNSDKLRDEEQKKKTKIQFANRDFISSDINKIYAMWSDVLGASSVSMRLLSGLHAHITIFMALTNIGDKVMLLPEYAGGHMATKQILERLGLEVCEFAVDATNHRIDKDKSIRIINDKSPKIIFFDRSEGLLYEDLTWLSEFEKIYKIFDASQYLTNIIAKDYSSPFAMGFDAIISTLHKNIPGPQHALFCTRKNDDFWEMFNKRIGVYVSNMHVFSIYSAGLLLGQYDNLVALSAQMLLNTKFLDCYFKKNGMPVVERKISKDEPYTHHIWIKCNNEDDAFSFYRNMESVGFLVNYRLLPYGLGYGIRIGLSAATYSGINTSNIEQLGEYILKVYNGDYYSIKQDAKEFINLIKSKSKFRSFNAQ